MKAHERSMLIVLLAVVLPNCRSDDQTAAYWENEREIIALNQRLKLCAYRLGWSGQGNAQELDDLKSLLTGNATCLRRLLEDKTALDMEIEHLETRNQKLGWTVLNYRRSLSRGMKFEILPANDGRLFENATITMVLDSGVEFRHEHGAARLRYGELSDHLRMVFGLNESAALAAEERERRQALAYEREIYQALEDIPELETPATAFDMVNRVPRVVGSQSPVSPGKRLISALSKPAKPFGNASFYRKYRRYDGYHSHRPVYRYVPACVRTTGCRPGVCASFKKLP